MHISPKQIREPYLSRRRKVGFDLFATYGIDRHDLAGRQRALLANFEFFGAPVGLFFVMRREWGLGAWLDLGSYMTNVMTLARAFGLEDLCAAGLGRIRASRAPDYPNRPRSYHRLWNGAGIRGCGGRGE